MIIPAGRIVILVCLLMVTMRAPGQTSQPSNDFESLLKQGFDAHQQAHYTEAIPLLRQAYGLRPHDYFANLLLGIDLLRTGKTGESVRYLKEATRLRPSEEIPLQYLGEANARSGHFAEAAIAYEQAVKVAPDSSDANMALAGLSLERFRQLSEQLRSTGQGLAFEYRLQADAKSAGDPAKEQFLRKAAAVDAGSPGLWSELALSEAVANQTEAAQRDLERAKQANPNDLTAWHCEAILEARAGNWKQAVAGLNAIGRRSPAVLKRALATWPSDLQPPENMRVSGAGGEIVRCISQRDRNCDVTLALTKKDETARSSQKMLFQQQEWERVAALAVPSSEDGEAWFRRGKALAEIGDCMRAIPALERSLVNGKQDESRFLLSSCYATRASEIAAKLEKSGDQAVVHMIRGDVMLRLQADASGATKEYEAALKDRPNDPALTERFGEAQLAAGNVASAKESAQRALQVDPNRLGAIRILAKAAMEERDYETALRYLKRLVKEDPNDASLHVELGTACAQTGNFEEALRNLRPALEAGYPDEKGSLHYQLGNVLRKLGRTADANAAFEEARQLSDKFQSNPREAKDEQP